MTRGGGRGCAGPMWRSGPCGARAHISNDEQRGGGRQGVLRNLPCSSSRKAWRSYSWVFMTMGPYQANGSWSGLPETEQETDAVVTGLDGDPVAAGGEGGGAVGGGCGV